MSDNLKSLLAFAAVYIIWGTTYLVIKIAIEDIPPFLLAAIRYSIAAFLLLSYCLIKGESVFTKNALYNILLGSFIMTFGQAIAFWAEKYISSGVTAVIGSLLPVCYIISDTRNWHNYKHSKLTFISIGLGLFGITILCFNPAGNPTNQSAWLAVFASVVTVIASFCWASGSLYFKYHTASGSLFKSIGWQLVGGMICCALISAFSGELIGFYPGAVSLGAWASVFYLAVAGSIVALVALYWLLARRPAATVGTYAYVNPVIAVLLGYLIAHEKISIIQIAGMILILIAAYIANQVKFQQSETKAAI